MCAPKSLLVVKTSSLGDLVHTFPAISDLASHFPGLHVDWIVEEAFSELPSLHPAIRHVIPVAIRRWRKKLWSTSTQREVSFFLERLRSVEYDAVLDFQGLLKSAFITRLGRGFRFGFDWASAREPLASLFYQKHCSVALNQHAVVRTRLLASCVFGYDLVGEPNFGLSTSEGGKKSRDVIFIHATSRTSKHWPETHWIDLGQVLAKQGWHFVLPWGNEIEQQRAQRLARHIPNACCLLRRLYLTEVAGVLASARGIIGVDTGLTHLAVALGRPVVSIYLDTDPALTGVWQTRNTINVGSSGTVPTVEMVLSGFRKTNALF
ncbi:Lipopolysaccharide heptosyltransferase 1 [Gammaproteobacteria bacterium]